ncbi:hypothetical protein Pint_07557 [Pistacia integerrima]|uniref:Uncharacterized protein n=1 Tax=Pistacia integerrima TaxID=434235 RepID=A0ACC0XVP5_9ROSI|nr:hypothetical protein Pint_07557 [Pistacia integerrima]
MDSSNLSSLPEESLEEELEQPPKRNEAPLPSAYASVPLRPPSQSSLQKYSPLDWLGYFDEEKDISILDSNDEQKDQLFFACMVVDILGMIDYSSAETVRYLAAGDNRLSFTLSAGKIKEKARVVAMDLRGHGKSSSENDLDLSVEVIVCVQTMCNDVLAVIKEMYGESPPAIVLVGHSMGGSVAVHVAAKKTLRTLAGLVVVDVVEGTAMASLIHMQKILSSRVQHFSSIEKAIEWSVKGGALRNIDSARVSIPSTLKYDDSKKCYVHRARLVETEQYWRG